MVIGEGNQRDKFQESDLNDLQDKWIISSSEEILNFFNSHSFNPEVFLKFLKYYKRTCQETKKEKLGVHITKKGRLRLLIAKKSLYFHQVLFFSFRYKLLPEDCFGTLVALFQQLKTQHKPRWLIAIIIFCNVLELLWAIYIQIKIENIWLPKRKVDE